MTSVAPRPSSACAAIERGRPPAGAAPGGRPPLQLSPLMPVSRDFAFVVARERAAGELARAAQDADKALIASVRVFDAYEGPGVAEGAKSVALEVSIQPREKTLTDAEIEALSARVVAAVEKATGVERAEVRARRPRPL